MTAPGWYHGNGDPEGSLRYWDGTQWQGDAAFPPAAATPTAEISTAVQPGTADDFYGVLAEPSAQPKAVDYAVLKPERAPIQRKRLGHFPILLKIIAIAVALFYALPLAIGLWLVLNPSGPGRQVFGGIDLTNFNPAGWLALIILIWIPGSLVVMVLGALWEKPGMVMAGGAWWIMVGGFSSWLAWEFHFSVTNRGGDPGIPFFAYFYTALLITQIGVMLWASRI